MNVVAGDVVAGGIMTPADNAIVVCGVVGAVTTTNQEAAPIGE
jgi:hypothetical protein